MTQRHNAPAEPAGDSASAEGKVEPSVRPKVMRRPASFSHPAPASAGAAMPVIHLPSPAQEENENLALHSPSVPMLNTPAVRPWQDDARFGAALLVLVLLVNLALIAWLPRLGHPVAAEGAVVDTATLPDEQSDVPEVTFYSRPGEVDVGSSGPARVHVLGGADSGPEQ